jgi:hypothetical protein
MFCVNTVYICIALKVFVVMWNEFKFCDLFLQDQLNYRPLPYSCVSEAICEVFLLKFITVY